MTQEELLQQNEKLNARLAKAIEVFKEQKETIERITAERDEAKKALSEIDELRAKLDEKSKNDDKFFEQVNEIQVLEKRVQKLSDDCEDAYEKLGAANEQIKQLESDKSMLEDSVNYETQLKEKALEENKDMKKTIDGLNEDINGMTTDYESLKAETQREINDLTDTNSDLQKTIDEQHETIENLTNALDKVNEDIQKDRKEFTSTLNEISNLAESKTRELLSSVKELCRTNCPV